MSRRASCGNNSSVTLTLMKPIISALRMMWQRRGQSGDAARDEFAFGVHPGSDQQRHDQQHKPDRRRLAEDAGNAFRCAGERLRDLSRPSASLHGGHLLVARTRGTRTDVVTIYDAKTLNTTGEVIIPARQLSIPDHTQQGVALLDRLTHHVHILEMNGDSFRLKHSKRHIRADDRPDHDPAD
jgi:hypothetical protein